MAFSFPTSPTLNQEYTFGTKTWRYNGTGWALVTGVDAAQSAWSTANLAYVNSNAATVLAQGAFDTANSKFDKAGGTISGSVNVNGNMVVTGNLSVIGNTFSLNVGSISSNDTVLYLGTGNYTSDSMDIGFIGHYNDGVNAHAGFIRDSGTKEWFLFKGYIPEVNANNNVIISDPSFTVDTLHANLKSTTVSIKNIDILPYANSIYDLTNASFIHANSGYIHANAAFAFANSLAGGLNTVNVSIDFSNDRINAAFNHANSGFIQANSGFIHANAAFNAANNALDTWVRGQANAAFIQANSSFIHANSGFIHANAAFNAANNATDTYVRAHANAAFIQANSGFIHANAAFDFANTLSGGAAIDNVARITANSGFIQSNAAFDHANAAFIAANSSPGAIGNAAYIHANSAFFHANAAYVRANNSLDANNGGSVSGTILSTANVRAVYVVANSGFTSAAGGSKLELTDIGLVTVDVAGQQFKFGASGIETSPGIFGGSFGGNKLSLSNETNLISNRLDVVKIQTGTDGTTPNEFVFSNNSLTVPGGITANGFTAGGINVVPTLATSYSQANAAFIRANNSLDANNGGTVTGDVRVTGNLTVTGTTTYVNTSTILIADNIITLNAAIDQASAPTVDAGIEVDRGNAANVYMLWNETEDRWTFTNDGVAYEGVGYASTASYANSAFTVANGAFIVANASSLQANAAFFHANSAYESQNATGQYANAAFIVANSAFDHANSAYESQNATGQYANAAFTVANGAFIHANAGFIIANVALLQANAAFQVANVAILQANSAFFHANSGFVHANGAFNHANGAYGAANSAGVYANSAYRHANAAFITANSGFVHANAAFLRANNSLNSNTGGTITGNVVVIGNVVADAFQTSGPAGDITGANAIFANYIFGANGTLDLLRHSNAAFTRANNSLDANNGGSVSGTILSTANVRAVYVVANSGFTSAAGGSKLELTDIGLVTVDVAGQQFKFGASGIESSPGIYGGSFGGNRLSLSNETNLISNRYDTVKIQTGTDGTTPNEWVFSNNSLAAPGGITASGFTAGGINVVPTLASSYDHANAAFAYANTATGAVVTFAAQPPASGNSNGHIWIDSADGTEYMYFKDVDGFQWVEFGPSSSNVSTNTFITANISASYAQANAAFVHANAAFVQANSGFIHTNAAFDKANSSITSDRLSSNLKLNIIQVLESANLYPTAIGGNVNIDIGNNTSYFFSSNTTANVTFNLRGNVTTTFDTTVAIGQTASVAIALKQGATKYKANVYIDGVLQTPYWLGNSAPGYATTQQQSIDVYTYTIFKTAASTYSILAANSNFGLAQGQPGQG